MNTYTQMFVTGIFFYKNIFVILPKKILDFISHTQTNEV